MARLPEGPRRLCILVGSVLALAWWWATRSLIVGVADFGVEHVTPTEWLVLLSISVAPAAVAFVAPFVATRVFLWVKRGFEADRAER